MFNSVLNRIEFNSTEFNSYSVPTPKLLEKPWYGMGELEHWFRGFVELLTPNHLEKRDFEIWRFYS